MLYSELLELIDNNKQITIVSNNKNTNSDVAKLYFSLYHNPLYSDKISISKTIIINHNVRTAIRGKVMKKENMKQIHFVHIDKLEKWMLETNNRMNSIFRLNSVKNEDLNSNPNSNSISIQNSNSNPNTNSIQNSNPNTNSIQNSNLNTNSIQDENEMKVLKKYKLYSKIMYNQRVIILLDDIKIPDKLNPSISITGKEIDTVEHHEWKLYLNNLIKKYNELKSKYFIVSLKPKRGRRKINLNTLEGFDFKPLTDEEKQIIRETNENSIVENKINETTENKMTDEQIEAMIKIQAQITDYNASRIYSNSNDLKEEDKIGLSDLETLEKRILYVYSLEPDREHPKYITKFDVIDDIYKLNIPKEHEILISIDETKLLNQYSKYSFDYGNAILFHISVNGLPQLINYKAPNYLNKDAYKNINILRIDYMILKPKIQKSRIIDFEIIKKAFYYVKNYNIHNTVQFEINNKINDDYRNEHGRTFLEIAEFINNDIIENNVKYIISHGTDVNYNLLLIEYERNMLKLDIFKNIIVINTKQHLWKRDIKEKLEDFEECKNCTTKIDMYYNLLKSRLRLKIIN
jgi:hypothetical protein